MSNISKELNYENKAVAGGSYRFSKILPNNGSQNVGSSLASTTESTFDIPSKCHNWSKSMLSFQMTFPDQTGAFANNVHAGCLTMIDRISLTTRGGVHLCDLNSVGNYSKTVLPFTEKYEDFTTRSDNDSGVTDALTLRSGSLFHPGRGGNQTGISDNTRLATALPDYTDISQLIVSAADNDIAIVKVQIPFSMFVHTILADARDFFFDDVLQLRIQWAPSNRWGFKQPIANVANVTGAASFTVAPSLQNLSLYLSVESNPDVCQQLVQKVNGGGLNMVIPYVYTYKQATTAGSNAVTVRLNRSHGKNLLRCYHTCFSNQENAVRAYENDNVASNKLTNMYSNLNYIRLQDQTLVCAENEDYLFLMDKMKGCTIRNTEMYKYSGNTWIDDWTPHITSEYSENDHIESGINLNDQEQIWSINTQTSVALNQYTFVVTQKLLNITAGNIMMI